MNDKNESSTTRRHDMGVSLIFSTIKGLQVVAELRYERRC